MRRRHEMYLDARTDQVVGTVYDAETDQAVSWHLSLEIPGLVPFKRYMKKAEQLLEVKAKAVREERQRVELEKRRAELSGALGIEVSEIGALSMQTNDEMLAEMYPEIVDG